MAIETLRQSTAYTVWFLDHSVDFRIRLYQFEKGERKPFDATSQNTWELQFYNASGSVTLRQSFVLAVDLIDTEDGVANLLQAGIRILSTIDASVGPVFCKVVSINGGIPSIFEAPWEAEIASAGPI